MQQHEEVVRPDHYSERLFNADLAPLKQQTWSWYNIFAFWMSDVHSVGGYVFAGSLFALGLVGWQVLLCLLVGIVIVQIIANLVAAPSQKAGVPYPVICRVSFGVFGANIPALVRGLIAVGWYGIQTYLASHALVIVMLRFFPEMAPYADKNISGFLGLSTAGWLGFAIMWILQAIVFWRGMEAVRRFIDWAGPAVYVVMFLLMIWIVHRAGWENISFNLSEHRLEGSDVILQMIVATSLVVSYFSGPTLNFGDFSRYTSSMKEVRRGNFWGLPINFLLFSVVTVVVISGTLPVFGRMIHDPIETVGLIDNTGVALIGAFTFVTATIGINIVANFVSPAFDFSNINPEKISWRMGGMIAAVGSVFITPWNLFDSPEVIHYTLNSLAAFIGPFYGILLVDYYKIQKQYIDVDGLFSDKPTGPYWYKNGYNMQAVKALAIAVVVGLACTHLPPILTALKVISPALEANWLFKHIGEFSLFIGAILAGVIYAYIGKTPPLVQAALAKEQ